MLVLVNWVAPGGTLLMAALTLVVTVEKIAPRGEQVRHRLGVALIVWGALVVVA